MEGLAALSFACNILQMLDSAGNAIGIIREVYKDGQTKDNDTVERTAKRLRDLCEAVDRQSKTTTLEAKLRETATENIALAEELIEDLSKLKGHGSTWTKLKTGVKALKNRTKVDKLQQQLGACERTFNTGILAALMERNEASNIMQGEGFKNLDTVLQGFIVRLSQGQVQTADLVKLEHAETRALVLKTTDALTSQIDASGLSRRRAQMRDSLRYPEMNARLNQIDEASPKTYDPFFEESSPHILTHWFREGTGTLWIQGKAGSGKSTLMKYIAQSPRVREMIDAKSPNFVLLHHFFWLSGSLIQRDLRGLLFSLAYQLAELVDDVHYGNKLHINDWSVSQLKSFVLNSLTRLAASTSVIILLDALDEYDEQCGKRKLLNLVTEMAEYSRICVSSRPEAFWVNNLQYNSHVRLENITNDAIREFISQEFACMEMTKSNELVEMLVRQAEGVFLWAFLAVKDVLRGLDSNATDDELRQRIERLPKGMENLYISMLKRIEEDWPLVHQEAALLFSLALFSRHVHWYGGSRLGGICLGHFYVVRASLLQDEDLSQDLMTFERGCERLEKRIIFVCAGMLEVIPYENINNKKGPLVMFSSVAFTHRTVQDFLRDAPYGRQLTEFGGWDPVAVVCELAKTEGIIYNLGHTDFNWQLVGEMLGCAHSVRDKYKVDEESHLKMILSIRQALEAAKPSNMQQSSKSVDFVHKSGFNFSEVIGIFSYASIDFLGLTLESQTMCYFNSLSLVPEHLTVQYMEYLLFCCVANNSSANAQTPLFQYAGMWDMMNPLGVTGEMKCRFVEYPSGRKKHLFCTNNANKRLLHHMLRNVKKDGVDNKDALRRLTKSGLNANRVYEFLIVTHDSEIMDFSDFIPGVEKRCKLLLVEGNAKYWLSIMSARFDVPLQVQRQIFSHVEDYEAAVPFKRLRLLIDVDVENLPWYGVPIFMNGKLSKSDEDGETLLQLWENAKVDPKGWGRFSIQDQEAMDKETDRLTEAVAAYRGQTGAVHSGEFVVGGNGRPGWIILSNYLENESLIVDENTIGDTKMRAFKDQ